MQGFFLLRKRNSAEFAYAFIDLEFKAVITCVDFQVLE